MPNYLVKTSIKLAMPVLFLVAAPSYAQDTDIKPQFYGAAGLGSLNYEPKDSDIPTISFKGGVKLNSYFGLEAELNSGLGKDKGVKLSAQKSVYGVGFLPVNDKFQLLGRVGFADTDLKSNPALDAGGGLSVGIGAQYDLSDKTALRFDLTNTDAKDSKGQTSNAGLSIVRKF
jgi:outer membrane immunogenic protein